MSTTEAPGCYCSTWRFKNGHTLPYTCEAHEIQNMYKRLYGDSRPSEVPALVKGKS